MRRGLWLNLVGCNPCSGRRCYFFFFAGAFFFAGFAAFFVAFFID
jgi:hypothetical protein